MSLSEEEEIELEADLEAEMRGRARNDLLAFTLYTKPDYEINWHHRSIAEKLNAWVRGEIKYLMVFTPPRHGKSELVSRRLPAFLSGKFPDAEIMACSYLDSLAMEMCIDVQEIIESKSYKRLFPKIKIPKLRSVGNGIRNNSEHTIMGYRGKYRSQGVGGSFTGKGANFIIIDDPIKGRQIADSEAFREQLWNFYTNDLFSRLETDLKTGRQGQVLITQTRWHEDDLSGRLLYQMKKDSGAVQWETIHFPAIRVDKDNPEDIREVGEPLWKSKYGLEQLSEIKASTTPRGWSAVYQQEPVPGDGTLFKESMFEFADLPTDLEYDYTFCTADTAYREKEENDFTVFTVFGVIDDQLYIIAVYRKQIASIKVEDEVGPFLKLHMSYGYRGTYIEPKGHGIYLNQAWRISGEFMIPDEDTIKEFYKNRRFDKVERANNVVPHLANRKIIINNSVPEKETLVAECLGFPKTRHDDFVDTVVDGLKMTYAKVYGILDVL